MTLDSSSAWDRSALSIEERQRQYSPSTSIGGDLSAVMAMYRENSAATRRAYPPETITYWRGSAGRSGEELDLYRPRAVPLAGAWLHVYLHGGYWQELGRADSSFHISALLDRGCVVAVPDYTLAPAASLDEIIDQCVAAVGWCIDSAVDWGARPDQVTVSGSSAGAHLAAMVATRDSRVHSAVLLSGVFELSPLIGTSINDAVGIDDVIAQRCSPMRLRPAGPLPIIVCDAEFEPDEFHAQSDEFSRRWAGHGCAVTRITAKGRNHFDLPCDLGDLGTPLGAAVARQ